MKSLSDLRKTEEKEEVTVEEEETKVEEDITP